MRALRKGMVYDHENNKIVGTVYTTEDYFKEIKALKTTGCIAYLVWIACWPLLSLFACEINIILGMLCFVGLPVVIIVLNWLYSYSLIGNYFQALMGVATFIMLCVESCERITEHNLENLPNEKIAAINDSLANTPQAISYKYADSIIANKQQENAAIQELARETNARNIPVNSILSPQGISDINRAVELENIRRKSVKDTANLDTLTQKSNINDLVKVMVALQTANPTDSAMIYNNIFKTPKSQKVLTQWQQSSDLTNGKTGKKLQALQKEFDQNNQIIAKQRPAIQRYDSVKKDITAHFDKVYAVKRDSLLKKLGKDVKQKQK